MFDQQFDNSEAAFMYVKAICFKDEKRAAMILKDQWPKNAKEHGRQIAGFDEAEWIDVREEIMYEVCLQKFLQNKIFADKLLATGNRMLVEASPFDRIWGIGLRPDDPRALIKEKWLGMNLLGFVLMQVRDTLKCVK